MTKGVRKQIPALWQWAGAAVEYRHERIIRDWLHPVRRVPDCYVQLERRIARAVESKVLVDTLGHRPEGHARAKDRQRGSGHWADRPRSDGLDVT